MKKILAIAGTKQSGKSTAANFVVGYTITQLARAGTPYLPSRFTIDEDNGDLIVNTSTMSIDNEKISGEGVLDLNNTDPEYVNWAVDCMHPHVKVYAYADLLKVVASTIFNIPMELINGTDEDKNKPTHITWRSMCALLPPKAVSNIKKAGRQDSKMTVREFLQYFGTNVCRKLYPNCWTESCFNRIDEDQSDLSIISDCRFENEVREARKRKAKVIKLEHTPFVDMHDSETGLAKMHSKNFDLIIPEGVTIKEKNSLILDAMYEWGWFDTHMELENNEGALC